MWTLILLACGSVEPADPPEPASATPPEEAAPPAAAPEPASTESVCARLDSLSVADPWALPGTDEPGATDEVRTRVLADTADWATRCTVNRMGSMDVGPSCALSGVDEAKATAVYQHLEADFRACHTGWMLMDESDDTTREVVAEKDGAIRFVRVRNNGERGWEVSIGAMPMP